MNKNDEQKLLNLISKWTGHFKHRKDFDEWKNRRIWQENHQQQMLMILEKIITDLKHKKILDLGCGMGGLLIAFKKEGFDAVGLDLNLDYCEITRLRGKRYDLDIEVTNSKAENMPFQNDSFDLIVCKDVIEHVQNPEQVLNECKRILKKNGQIFTSVINRFSYIDPHYHLRFLNWLPKIMGSFIAEKISKKDVKNFKDNQKLCNMHYFTIRGFETMVKKIGFSNCINLTKKDVENKKMIFTKMPFLKEVFLNLYLSSWKYFITK